MCIHVYKEIDEHIEQQQRKTDVLDESEEAKCGEM